MANRKSRHKPAEEQEWYHAQVAVGNWLYNHGIKAKMMPYRSPYDLLAFNGLRIEVKAGGYTYAQRGWRFNIHRHGVLDEAEVDFYILRCEAGFASEFLGLSASHLVVPAPLRTPTLIITVRNLLCGFWAGAFNNIDCLLSYDPHGVAKGGLCSLEQSSRI